MLVLAFSCIFRLQSVELDTGMIFINTSNIVKYLPERLAPDEYIVGNGGLTNSMAVGRYVFAKPYGSNGQDLPWEWTTTIDFPPREVVQSPTQGRIFLLIGLCLFAAPFLLIWLKNALGPESVLNEISLAQLPPDARDSIGHVMFVPLAAMLVVFTRLTLGFRVLGPFRSILLAVAFQVTGVLLGLAFAVLTVGAMVILRRVLRKENLTYYARVTIMMSSVALMIAVALLIAAWCDWQELLAVAYFPVVVLCLVGDAFGRTVDKEGWPSAIWRGILTAVVAIILTSIANVPEIHTLFLEYPELLLPQIGLILLIANRLNWRLLETWNPVMRDDENEF